MPPIRLALFQNVHIVGLQRKTATLTVDVFGGKAAFLNHLGIHEPLQHPMDAFSMQYDNADEALRDYQVLSEWMTNDEPIKVEIYSPERIVFSSPNYPQVVEFEQRVQKTI